MRPRGPPLKEAVEPSLAGDIRWAFEKLADNVAEVKPGNLVGSGSCPNRS